MSFNKSSNFPDYGSTDSRLGGTRNARIQSKSNFDMNTYHQLCDYISCNIFSINNNVTALEKASKEVGTAVDTPLLREKMFCHLLANLTVLTTLAESCQPCCHTTQQSTKDLVSSTTQYLKQLTAIVASGGREHRLQAERVRNEFHATVQRYDTLQKQLGPKMKQAALQSSSSRSGGNVWMNEEEEGEEVADERQSLMESERLHQQHQLQEELEFERGLLVEREQRIRQIESDMLDVNQVFRDLAAMVHEQGDTIGTIEENITSVAYNVEEGQQQLAKASTYQKAYRKKLCCLILILVVVAVALTLVLYFSLHSS